MKTPPKFKTPEFKGLKAEWDQKLADSGFDDPERPPPCRPGSNPSRHAAFYRDYIRSDNPAGHNVPLDDLLAAENSDDPPIIRRDETSVWTGPFDYLEEALFQGFPFKSRTDRAIARRLHKGQTHNEIAARLHVGKHRIQRVIRDIKAWLAGR